MSKPLAEKKQKIKPATKSPREKPVSLYPLSFEEAMRGLLGTTHKKTKEGEVKAQE